MFTTLLHNLWGRKRRLLASTVAVVLGVAFLVATMVVGDSTKAGMSDQFAAMTQGTDAVIRSASRLGETDDRQTGLVDTSVLPIVARLPEVASAAPRVEGVGQVVGTDGAAIGGDGPPTMIVNWIDDPDLAGATLVEGSAPRAVPDGQPFEAVIDVDTAARGGLEVGDVTWLLAPARTPVQVVGLAQLGDGGANGGVTWTALQTDVAQRLTTGGTDQLTAIMIHAADGVDQQALVTAVDDALAAAGRSGLDVLTGAEYAADLESDVDASFLNVFRTMLIAFAGIAVVVATFSIANTFSILVAQRTRESALLRAIGASRRQVIVAVAVEALAIGVIATAIGVGAGVGLGAGLNALLESSLDMPANGLVVSTTAVIVALAVGVGTTLVASVGPAMRASRVSPLAALREVAIDRSASGWKRAVLGVVTVGAGVVALVTATSAGSGALARAGLGALGLLAGFVLLGPVVARPAAAVLGVVPATFRGLTGRFARRNAMRNPRRTAASASALMIGTAVVALFTTFGASLKASIDDAVDTRFNGDLVIIPNGFSGAMLPPELADELAALPEVATVAGSSFAPALLDGRETELAGAPIAELVSVFDIGVTGGSLAGFGAGDVAISDHYAEANGLGLGSPVHLEFADGTEVDGKVAVTYEDRFTYGDVFVDGDFLAEHLAQPNLAVVLVDLADGVDLAAGKAAVTAVTDASGAPAPMDAEEYRDDIGAEVDGMLSMVYALLAVAVVIALIGIGNTLSLSVYDRTRELGLLRAVGQDRRQLRATVRWESVIVAVFGTVGGLGLGTLCGWGIIRALDAEEGFGTFDVPLGSLGAVVVLAIVAGVVAAVRPARRAARTDILTAIAND